MAPALQRLQRLQLPTLPPLCRRLLPRPPRAAVSGPLLQAASARLSAAAAAAHVPVQAAEQRLYQQRLGDAAYVVKVYV
jgi:hypothetical protein